MNLRKENVCVFIENEAQLNEAKELLEKHNQKIESEFAFFHKELYNKIILAKYINTDEWYFTDVLVVKRNKITLSELETILKQQ